MSKTPASLGDSKIRYKLVQEVHPLPDSRKGLIGSVEQILNTGGVQKLVIEMNHPIRVDRLVSASNIIEPEELPEEDLLSAIRNGEVIEFQDASKNPFETLFRAFQYLSKRKVRASTILIHKMSELNSWLGLTKFEHLEDLFGIELHESNGVADQTALIVASDPEDFNVITLTLKVDLHNETVHGKGT